MVVASEYLVLKVLDPLYTLYELFLTSLILPLLHSFSLSRKNKGGMSEEEARLARIEIKK